MHRGARLISRLIAGAGVTLGAGAVLGGCSSAVEVAVPSGASAPACASAAWPETVARQPARDTDPRSPATRAWGEDAIVARCGVPALAPTSLECITVDDVDWVIKPLSDGTSFTTYGTDPALEVLVPKAYAPEPLLLPVFTAVARTLPDNGRACVG